MRLYLIESMRGKGLYGGKDLDIFETLQELMLGEIGRGIVTLTSRP